MRAARHGRCTAFARAASGGADRIEEPVSRCRLLEDQLLQGQIKYGTTQPGVLGLKLLQPLDLVALQTAVLRSPPLAGHFGHANRPNSFIYRPACATTTSTCCSFATISSAVYRFFPIRQSSIPFKARHQGGPLFRGRTKRVVQIRRKMNSVFRSADATGAQHLRLSHS